MVLDAIKNFHKQLKYRPEIQNDEAFQKRDKFIVAGMGGSNLASGLLKIWNPKLDIIIHRDYGLPDSEKELDGRLVIASSYSGNTAETIDTFKTALDYKLPVIAISTGGKLLELAKELKAPYIQLPDLDTQPRLALGVSLKAMAKAMGEVKALSELEELAESLDSGAFEPEGKELAEKLNDKIPLIYSSVSNKPLAYIWKAMINEDAKIPAFCNVFPEANHNDMNGFDSAPAAEPLSAKFHFIFLKDGADDERIQTRMNLAKKMYEDRGLGVEIIGMPDGSVWDKIFRIFFLAEWTAYYLAKNYKVDPEKTLLVEEFKKAMDGK